MTHLTDLRDERFFPTFGNCPSENDIDEEYYTSSDGFHFNPHTTVVFSLKSRMYPISCAFGSLPKTNQDKNFPIAFYLEDGDTDQSFSCYLKSHTVAILYAQQHNFMDLSVGIRQETITGVRVSS